LSFNTAKQVKFLNIYDGKATEHCLKKILDSNFSDFTLPRKKSAESLNLVSVFYCDSFPFSHHFDFTNALRDKLIDREMHLCLFLWAFLFKSNMILVLQKMFDRHDRKNTGYIKSHKMPMLVASLHGDLALYENELKEKVDFHDPQGLTNLLQYSKFKKKMNKSWIPL